jgi:hypothetical protein
MISKQTRLNWLEWVDDRIEGKQTAFRLAYQIFRHVNYGSGTYWAKQETLADAMGRSVDAVRVAARDLKKIGAVQVSGGKGKGCAYEYTPGVTIPKHGFFNLKTWQKHLLKGGENPSPTRKSNTPGAAASAKAAAAPVVLKKKRRKPDRVEQIPLNRIRWYLDKGLEVPQEIIGDVHPDLRYLIPEEALSGR